MLIRRHAEGYNFLGDTETGVTLRWGATPEEDPAVAHWPELADISISNHCSAGCDFCYRNSVPDKSFLSLGDYEFILDGLTSPQWGSIFQVALGGGEPLEHPQFLEILDATCRRGIIANFTTNGRKLTPELAGQLNDRVGAVAVSVARINDLVRERIHMLTDAGIKTNLHYILDQNSLHEAISILEGQFNSRLDGINAIIFLTYKPSGRGTTERTLLHDESFEYFLQQAAHSRCLAHIGFDACMVPALLSSGSVDAHYVDSCECAFFSIYIDEKLNVKPCSFALHGMDTYSLREYSMQEIWDDCFAPYRNNILRNKCGQTCSYNNSCHGRCSYFNSLQYCYRASEEPRQTRTF